MKTQYLVNTPQAVEFVNGMMSRTVLNARLGNIDGIPGVSDSVNQLKDLMSSTAQKISALAGDASRTLEAQHAAAATLTERVSKEVRKVGEQIAAKGHDLQLEGADLANEAFAPRPGYGHLDAEIRGYLREAVKSPSGLSEVAEMAKKDAAIAGIIYHSPHYLIGVPKSIHEKWQANAVINHVPKAATMVEQGSTLIELAKKYEGVVRDAYQSFHSPQLAEKYAKTRVEV